MKKQIIKNEADKQSKEDEKIEEEKKMAERRKMMDKLHKKKEWYEDHAAKLGAFKNYPANELGLVTG